MFLLDKQIQIGHIHQVILLQLLIILILHGIIDQDYYQMPQVINYIKYQLKMDQINHGSSGQIIKDLFSAVKWGLILVY